MVSTEKHIAETLQRQILIEIMLHVHVLWDSKVENKLKDYSCGIFMICHWNWEMLKGTK